jgi:hypothetical protein
MKFLKKLKILFSPRFWVPVILVQGVLIHFFPEIMNTIMKEPLLVMIVTMGIAFIVTAINFMSVYTINSERDFIMDQVIDVVILLIAAIFLIIGIYESASGYVLTIILIAFGISVVDYLASLVGGASKLLEMDKTQIQR